MFLSLLHFEMRFHCKKLSFYIILALSLFLGFSLFLDLPGGGVNDNSPYRITYFVCVISLTSLVPSMLFSIQALLRDTTSNFDPILFSTPIRKVIYMLSRHLGVFISTLIVSSASLLGFYFGKYLEPEYVQLGTESITYYLWPWLLIMIPNLFINNAIIGISTMLSQKAIIAYTTGIVLLIIFWLGSFYNNSPLTGGQILAKPEIVERVAYFDFFGIGAFLEQTQFWTPYKKNHQFISFSGSLFWNRILWTLIGGILLIIGYNRFSFRKVNRIPTKKKTEEIIIVPKIYTATSTDHTSIVSHIQAFYSQCIIEFRNIFKSIPFVIMTMAWIAMTIIGMYFMITGEAEFGGRYPTTNLLAGLIVEPFEILSMLLVIFYCGELVWKPCSVGFNEILSSTPVKNGVLLLSKYTVLTLLLFLFLTIGISIGIAFQLIDGYGNIELAHYVSLYYYSGVPIVFVIFFTTFLQICIPNKYLAMLATGVLLLFFKFWAPTFILNEPLARFLNFGRMYARHSDMYGYGQFAKPFHSFIVYWGSLIGIIVVLSLKWGNRGSGSNYKTIRSSFSKIGSRTEKIFILTFVILFIGSGSYIFYNTHLLNPVGNTDEYWSNEQYERLYKKYESLTIPAIVGVETNVDIFPKERAYTINANYIIKNTSDEPIYQIFATTREDFESFSIENTKQTLKDTVLGAYLFELKKPFLPGEKLSMQFSINKETKGFGISKDVISNSSYLQHSQFDPLLGYVNFIEIKNPNEREKRGLPERPELPYNDPHLQDVGKFLINTVAYESIVSTSEDQTAIASGELIKQWSDNGRNYFHYKTATYVKKNMTYFSARYDVKKIKHDSITIEMYYHPTHYHNIDFMAEIAKKTLTYATKNFSPYQHNHLRIAEVGGHRNFGGQAMPGTISMSETSMYTKDIRNPDKGINVVARRTIHEIAHEWWGHQLAPKRVEGAKFLSEALCKYTEAVVLEKLYGKGMVRQLTNYTSRRYFGSRSNARTPEPPLYLVNNQQYLAYSKGYVIFNGLRSLIGEDQVNKALQNVLEKHHQTSEVTSLDFLKELYAITPKNYHTLLEDWFKKVIVYDLRIINSTYKKLQDNTYEIEIITEAKRTRMLESGEEISIGIDEPIEIGLFTKHPNDFKLGDVPIYLKKHSITTGKQTFKIIVDTLPTYIGVDPFLTRLDESRIDNVKTLSKHN